MKYDAGDYMPKVSFTDIAAHAPEMAKQIQKRILAIAEDPANRDADVRPLTSRRVSGFALVTGG